MKKIIIWLTIPVLAFNFKMAFGQFDNVNLFTGTVEINIPITDIKLKDFTLPISLSYSASGIKVADKATWTGLGWNLNTGGYIARITRGDVDNANNISSELEPDIFIYSIGAKSGKFVIDKDKIVNLIPFYNIQIEPVFSAAGGNITGFRIHDDDGTIYTFLTSVYSTYTDSYSYCTRCPNFAWDCDVYSCEGIWKTITGSSVTSYSWYLTNIITKNNEELNFNYANENCWTRQLNLNTSLNLTGQRLINITSQNEIVEFNVPTEYRDDDPSSKFLDNILIKRKNSTGDEIVKGFKFDYVYNVSNDGANPGTTPAFKRLMLNKLYMHDGLDNLKLPSYEFGYYTSPAMPNRGSNAQDLWGYYDSRDAATKLTPTIYIYPDEATDQYRVLPIPGYTGIVYTKAGEDRAPYSDYAKALTLATLKTPDGATYSYTFEPNKYIYQNNEYQGGGIRIQQISVSGGITQTMNTTYNYIDYDNNNKCSGKLLGIPMYAHYSLSGVPHNYTELTPTQFYNYSTEVSDKSLIDDLEAQIVYNKVEVIKGFMGKSLFTFHVPYTFNENNAEHSSLIIENADNFPKSSYQISESDDPNVIIYKDYEVECDDDFTFSFVTRNAYFKRLVAPLRNYNIFPFSPNSNYDWDNGQLMFKTDYDSNGNIVKQISNTYDNFYANSTSIKIINAQKNGIAVYLFDHADCITCGLFPPTTHCAWERMTNLGEYRMGVQSLRSSYQILTGVSSKLSSSTETIYNSNGISITNSTNYSYNSIGQISLISQTQSDGSELKTICKYVPDYLWGTSPSKDDQTGILYSMSAQNMINSPIEITQLKGNNVIGSTLNLYKITSDNIIVPDVTYGLEIANPTALPFMGLSYTSFTPGIYGGITFNKSGLYRPKIVYDQYSANGNILQSHKINDNLTSYIWGYNQTLPIAQAINSNANELFFTSYEEDADFGSYITQKCTSDKHTGDNCISIPAGGYNIPHDFTKTNLAHNKYKYSAWVKTSCTGMVLVIKDLNDGNPWITTSVPNTNGQWQYVEVVADITVADFSNCTTVRAEIWNNGSATAYADDVRFAPADALMSTYTYKPLVGKTSETNEKSITTYYEYDSFGRLKLVKDQDGNIVKKYDYHYQQ